MNMTDNIGYKVYLQIFTFTQMHKDKKNKTDYCSHLKSYDSTFLFTEF